MPQAIQRSVRVLAVHGYDLCSPWRVGTPFGALRDAGFALREASPGQVDDPGAADLVVIVRPFTLAALQLIETAHRNGIPVVVDVDDLFQPEVLAPESEVARVLHPLAFRREAEERAAAGVGSWEAVAAAPPNRIMEWFWRCLEAADALTVSTPPLAEAYRRFNPHVHVLPNCYDDADPLWDVPPPTRQTVHVGFAGSDNHRDNLALLRGALEPVLRAHPEVRLLEAGALDLLPHVDAPPEQLVHLGTLPFPVFPLLLRQMDVVLAPLVDEPFNGCKSNIRCMTAGLVGAPVVASPVGAYAAYVRDGENGFLARSAREWALALERLVADPALRRRMGAANRRCARRFAISRHAHRWMEVYDSLLRHPCRT
jgi:glycosyltransferase involved in cell wall biosynthesis